MSNLIICLSAQLCYIEGMNWQIDFYSDIRGNEPVKNFIYAQSLGAQVEITHVISLLQEFALPE